MTVNSQLILQASRMHLGPNTQICPELISGRPSKAQNHKNAHKAVQEE
jgi:hypothetical protein